MSGANVIKDVGDLSGHTWLRPPRAALRCSRWQGREGRVTDTRIDAWPKAKGAEARRPAEGAAWRAIDGRRGLAHARGCPRGRATDGTKPCASCKQVATTRMASREWEAAISSQRCLDVEKKMNFGCGNTGLRCCLHNVGRHGWRQPHMQTETGANAFVWSLPQTGDAMFRPLSRPGSKPRIGRLLAWVCGTHGRRLVAVGLAALAANALATLLLLPRQRRVDPPVIRVQEEHGLVEVLAPPGQQVFYTKDGSMPTGKSSTELYLSPFTLYPGSWQLVAIAKHRGSSDSEAARFPPLVCARDEDGISVFCRQQDLAAAGDAKLYGHPELLAGRCRFPAGDRLREVSDIFAEDAVTIVNVSVDPRTDMGRVGLVAASERHLCRQVSSHHWPECRGRHAAHGAGGALTVEVKRHYIAAVSCGFLGFAPRVRRERLAGAAPQFGGVVFDARRYFRHQPFVPQAVTSYQGPGGGVAPVEHFSTLAVGTCAAAFGADSLHQILPGLLYMARTLPASTPIVLPLTVLGALDTLLDLVRRADPELAVALAPARLLGWRAVLYGADTMYFYGEWPFDARALGVGEAVTDVVRPGRRASLLPLPLLFAARAALARIPTPSTAGPGSSSGGAGGGGRYVVLVPNGRLRLSAESKFSVMTALEVLTAGGVARGGSPLVLLPVEGGGEVMERGQSTLLHLLAVFQNAAAVIGVHGPMLSYMVVCREGTPILELGFALPESVRIGTAARAAGHVVADQAVGEEPRRWTRTYRRLASALGLPFWALPAAWVSLDGSELVADALQIAAWLAGPAAESVGRRDRAAPAHAAPPSRLGETMRVVAAKVAREEASEVRGSAADAEMHHQDTVGGKMLKGMSRENEAGASTESVIVEGDVGWLVCRRERQGARGELQGDLARNQPVRVSSEHPAAGDGARAVDGRSSTRWMSVGMQDKEWLEVDLGAVFRVCAVHIEWGVATARQFAVQAAAPQRFEAEYVAPNATDGPGELDVSRFTRTKTASHAAATHSAAPNKAAGQPPAPVAAHSSAAYATGQLAYNATGRPHTQAIPGMVSPAETGRLDLAMHVPSRGARVQAGSGGGGVVGAGQGLGTKDDEILSVVVDSLLGDSVGGEKREVRRVLLESKGEGSSQGSGLASVQDKDR